MNSSLSVHVPRVVMNMLRYSSIEKTSTDKLILLIRSFLTTAPPVARVSLLLPFHSPPLLHFFLLFIRPL